MITTITLSKETKKMLEEQGYKSETYDQLIKRILKERKNATNKN